MYIGPVILHTTESLVSDPCPFEADIATANLESYKWAAELIQTGGEISQSEICKFVNSV
jgi:hypothetical protein